MELSLHFKITWFAKGMIAAVVVFASFQTNKNSVGNGNFVIFSKHLVAMDTGSDRVPS